LGVPTIVPTSVGTFFLLKFWFFPPSSLRWTY